MKKFLIFFILINNVILSQTIKKAIGLYNTEFKQKTVKGKSSQAGVFFNTITGVLIIEDNLSAIRIDNQRADTLNDRDPVSLHFEANVGKNISSIIKNNQSAPFIKIEGALNINGISFETVAYWSPVQLDPNSPDLYINFELKFNGEDFNLPELYFPFTKLVEFNIENGLINKVQ